MITDAELYPWFALWENTSAAGNTYYAGRVGDLRVVGFPNRDKKHPRDPDIRLYVSPWIKREDPKNDGGYDEQD